MIAFLGAGLALDECSIDLILTHLVEILENYSQGIENEKAEAARNEVGLYRKTVRDAPNKTALKSLELNKMEIGLNISRIAKVMWWRSLYRSGNTKVKLSQIDVQEFPFVPIGGGKN